MKNYELVIIGGGAAGMGAAIEARKNGINDILIIEKTDALGGILNQCIHTGFGLTEFKEEMAGPEYAAKFIKQIEDLKIDYLCNTYVTKITEQKEIYFSNQDGYQRIKAKAIILSTGCYERSRGKANLDGTRPSGVMTAGLAQKYINIDGYMVGKKVFILGSGDIGLIMARRLTLEGAKVLGVAELMPYTNGLSRNVVQCLNDFNIPLYLSHTVKEIVGTKRLEKVIIAKVDENKNFIPNTEIEFECDTLLLSVGLIPSNELLEPLNVKMNSRTKGPIVNEKLETSMEGIFVCGNNLHVHDLVDYVTKEARIAGQSAANYIHGMSQEQMDLEIKNGPLVNYVVPSFASTKTKMITIKFRVAKPLKQCTIKIKNNGHLLREIKKDYMLPAEMENINVSLLQAEKGEIEIEVTEND